MLLSERGLKRYRTLLLSGLLALAVVPADTSAEVVYETSSPFCESSIVRDFLKPTARMPALREPDSQGRIGFAPESMRLLRSSQTLLDGGTVGYTLFLVPRSKSVHPGWRVKTTLARVDWRGRTVEVLDELNRRVWTLRQGYGAGVKFEISGKPAVYRVISTFEKGGRKLGEIGFYYRLMEPFGKAQMATNAPAYHAGSTVFSRVENHGTETVFYGVPYRIERFDGTTWTVAPETPRGPWITPLYNSGPGMSGGDRCNGFWVPPSMAAGRYRISKEVEFGAWRWPVRRSQRILLSAEFDVVP